MHRQLAAAAQRHAANGRNDGHLGVAHAQHHLLQLLLHRAHQVGPAGDVAGQHGFEVGADRERLAVMPDDQALVVAFGRLQSGGEALGHLRADDVHLGLERGDQHFVIERPHADGLVLEHGLAGAVGTRPALAQQQLGKDLARIDRQRAARLELARARVPRALVGVHAAGLGHRALEDPVGQRRGANRLAGVDVVLDHLGHIQPAGLLPQLERTLLHAEAPAHGLIDVARGVGNALQVHGGVVKAVAQDGPQELAFGAGRIFQELQALCRRALQHAAVHRVGLGTGRHVAAAFQVEAQHVAPGLLEVAGLGLLAQVAQFDQFRQIGRRAEGAIERVRVRAQLVLLRLDDVAQRVQAHHVGGAEGAA